MVINIDEVKPKAVTSATGICVIAKNQHITAMPCIAPRIASKPIRFERWPLNLNFIKIGTPKIKPNTYRIKAACIGFNSEPSHRTMPVTPTKQRPDKVIQAIPCTAELSIFKNVFYTRATGLSQL